MHWQPFERVEEGKPYREFVVEAAVANKSLAQRWGENRERHLLLHGRPEPEKEVPTLRRSRRDL